MSIFGFPLEIKLAALNYENGRALSTAAYKFSGRATFRNSEKSMSGFPFEIKLASLTCEIGRGASSVWQFRFLSLYPHEENSLTVRFTPTIESFPTSKHATFCQLELTRSSSFPV